MAKIENVQTDLYKIPLASVLTDSTHGIMQDFELITVRITDSDGAVGLGYTYTVNYGGAAVAVMIDRYLAPLLAGKDADLTEALWPFQHSGIRSLEFT